ncbi:MAG: hypothetical protein AAGN66_24510 [Acidobacteriota bacterium]
MTSLLPRTGRRVAPGAARRRIPFWIAGALVGCLLLACGQGETPAADAPAPQKGSFADFEAADSRLPARHLDPVSLRNMSELLAGTLPDGEKAELDPAWAEHGRFMDEAWGTIAPRLEAMGIWAEGELADIGSPEAPVLYPFGGPDLISVLQFFPDAGSYLLVGLEAPGHLPMPEQFSGDALAADLERLRRPFESLVEAGYFVRNEIDKDLKGGAFDGVLPILLICLARAGLVPESLDYVTIDPTTYQIAALEPDAATASAVRVTFRPAADPQAPLRSVYYFSQDLSDDGLFLDDPWSGLMWGQEAINVYMKSAEYLSHLPTFSNFRKLVLERGQTILQDDSGLPLKSFTSDRWDVGLYGRYSGVLAAYSQWHQDDLEAAFAGPDVEPLGFSLGYNSGGDGGCLILAERRADAGEPAG